MNSKHTSYCFLVVATVTGERRGRESMGEKEGGRERKREREWKIIMQEFSQSTRFRLTSGGELSFLSASETVTSPVHSVQASVDPDTLSYVVFHPGSYDIPQPFS